MDRTEFNQLKESSAIVRFRAVKFGYPSAMGLTFRDYYQWGPDKIVVHTYANGGEDFKVFSSDIITTVMLNNIAQETYLGRQDNQNLKENKL